MQVTNITKLGLALVISFGFMSLAHGQSGQYKRPVKRKIVSPKVGEKAGAKKQDSEKLDISDLEKKYWAPKDTDFSVVQNRTYTKNRKWALGVSFGPVINDTFSTGFNLNIDGDFFFSERWGAGFSYSNSSLKNSKATDTFVSGLGGGGVHPDFNRITSYFGVSASWVPFYAKMSVLGKKITYFDMAITPTLGITNYEQLLNGGNSTDSSFTYGLDITQYYFFHKNFALKATFKNRWFTEERKRYTNTAQGSEGDSLGSQTANTTMILIGVTWFFDPVQFLEGKKVNVPGDKK